MSLLFAVPMFLFMFVAMRPLSRSSASFAEHKDNVKILEAKMNFEEDRVGAYLTFLGKIQNDSPVKWDNPYFEVHCFNKDGEMIDTSSSYDSGLILIPKTEHAFKLSFSSRRLPSTYATFKIYLRDARDANRWF